MHPCGVLLSDRTLLNRTAVQESAEGFPLSQLDKDDAEIAGVIKLDVLGVRMQSAMAHTLAEIRRTTDERIDIDAIARDDQATYAMIQRSDTIGCFQIESPGQRELVKKLAPRDIADLIVDISLFRPGPVNSDMIGPFLRTRHGLAEPRYPHENLADALQETGGVVVFHEQVLRIIDVLTGCGLAEADLVRRHLSTEGGPERTAPWFRAQALARGFDPVTVERVWQVVAAFGGFGFCKAHAAAFAIPVYQSAWLKRHHPAAFFAGVLTHDPGMYPKRVIIADARLSGVQVLPVDINASSPTGQLPPGGHSAARHPRPEARTPDDPRARTVPTPPARPRLRRPRPSPGGPHPPGTPRACPRHGPERIRQAGPPEPPPLPRRSAAPCARSRASATPRSPASSPASPTPACVTSGTAPGSPAPSRNAWSSSAPSTPSTPPSPAAAPNALTPPSSPGTPRQAAPASPDIPRSAGACRLSLRPARPGGTCSPGWACWPGSPPPARTGPSPWTCSPAPAPGRRRRAGRRHGGPRPRRRAPRTRPSRNAWRPNLRSSASTSASTSDFYADLLAELGVVRSAELRTGRTVRRSWSRAPRWRRRRRRSAPASGSSSPRSTTRWAWWTWRSSSRCRTAARPGSSAPGCCSSAAGSAGPGAGPMAVTVNGTECWDIPALEEIRIAGGMTAVRAAMAAGDVGPGAHLTGPSDQGQPPIRPSQRIRLTADPASGRSGSGSDGRTGRPVPVPAAQAAAAAADGDPGAPARPVVFANGFVLSPYAETGSPGGSIKTPAPHPLARQPRQHRHPGLMHDGPAPATAPPPTLHSR